METYGKKSTGLILLSLASILLVWTVKKIVFVGIKNKSIPEIAYEDLGYVGF